MIKKCYLDMDGVLADFNAGAMHAHVRESAYCDPDNYGRFEIEQCWEITPEQFWEPCIGYHFWRTLPTMPDAQRLVDLVLDSFGVDNVAILTVPHDEDRDCVRAKHDWMLANFPALAGNMIFTQDKSVLASPWHWLIDDRDKNLQSFERAGGHPVRVPRLWNIDHASAYRSFDIVKSVLEKSLELHAVLEGSLRGVRGTMAGASNRRGAQSVACDPRSVKWTSAGSTGGDAGGVEEPVFLDWCTVCHQTHDASRRHVCPPAEFGAAPC